MVHQSRRYSRAGFGVEGAKMISDTVCQECGASLPSDGDCWNRVYELLEIEGRALASLDPEAAKRAHFFAVATYQLQHSSRLTLPILLQLQTCVAEMLAPNARPIEEMRRDLSRTTNGSQRVTNRAPAGDRSHVPGWPQQWSITVVDIVTASDNAYPAEVARWARATLHDIARAETA